MFKCEEVIHCFCCKMKQSQMSIIIIIVLLLWNQVNTKPPESPCPKLFTYEKAPSSPEGDVWQGSVKLQSKVDLNGVWLHLMFDRTVLELGNWFGDTVTTDGTNFLIKNHAVFLRAKVPETVKFYVKYDKKYPPPKFIGFMLNGKMMCPKQTDVTTTLRLHISNHVKNVTQTPAPDVPKPRPKLMVKLRPTKPTTPQVIVNNSNQLKSPCPSLFIYETSHTEHNEDKWYGRLTILSDTDLNGVFLRIILDKPAIELGNWFGQVDAKAGNTDFIVKNRSIHLKAFTPQTIRFYIKYKPNGPTPRLIGFKLNSKTVCPAEHEDAMLSPLGFEAIPTLESSTGSQLEIVTKPTLPATTTEKPFNSMVVDQLGAPLTKSPCPRLFVYEPNNSQLGEWHGRLTLKSDVDLKGIWLEILLNAPALILGNWFGETTTEDNTDFLIKNPEAVLKAEESQTVRFYVKYDPSKATPAFIGFRLNGRAMCPNHFDEATANTGSDDGDTAVQEKPHFRTKWLF